MRSTASIRLISPSGWSLKRRSALGFSRAECRNDRAISLQPDSLPSSRIVRSGLDEAVPETGTGKSMLTCSRIAIFAKQARNEMAEERLVAEQAALQQVSGR